MKQYLDLLRHVRDNGVVKGDRTGTGTVSVFGYQTRYNLSEGFPLVTTKKAHLRSIIHELLWFISGSTNTKYLNDNGVTIWDEWADENGDLGPVYGSQWRRWQMPEFYNGLPATNAYINFCDETVRCYFDQLAWVINEIQNNPNSRRLIVNSWNVGNIPEMALPPCHMTFQFYVENGKLSCHLYLRSADLFLGIPFNIASYALLTQMVAQVCDLEVGDFVHTLGDAHIYLNHMEQVEEQLSREPRALPKMVINPDIKNIDDFRYEDFELFDYNPHPAIKGEVSV